MDQRQLQAFITVAEERHFGRAAERLNLASSPLGRLIRALEDEVGTPLLSRTTRRVDLTAAGAAFLPQAQAILDQLGSAAQLARRAAQGETGRVRLGYMGAAQAALLPRLWRALRAAHPDVQLEVSELCTPDQRQALLAGELDAGLMALPVWHDELLARPLARIPLLAALPREHPLATRPSLTLRALAQEEWLTCTPYATTLPPEQVQALCMAFGLVPRTRAVGGSEHAVVARVAAGVGVTLVPQTLVNPQQEGVTFIPLDDQVTLDVGLVTRADHRNPALTALLGAAALTFPQPAAPPSAGAPA
ncbi:transcriptional regulator [Deinococcus arenae]|uniref:Transcriptional regulator n=1 Tax=Deinococcus arenae TaxID=1452751 RepID=A0A8H9L6T2_9DEIO|nr:LysR substrate-binding domain-containing protein [Deinococcus arenae]AWT37606.1 LysR family transcriptional regulator [Deinococcus actinosclerus]GGM37088.1 transcriptional regulator [Deinococcus arenae]